MFTDTRRNRSVAFVLAAVCLMSAVAGAGAQEVIAPGEDAYELVEDGVTRLDFAEIPIPAGFFGPGSDPFTGSVALKPSPMMPDVGGPRAVRPLEGVFGGPDPIVIPTEIISLNLVSVGSITITAPYGDSFFDVAVTLTPDAPAGGQWVVQPEGTGAGGVILPMLPDGDFAIDSFFDVTYTISFTETCGCSFYQLPPVSERLDLLIDVPWSRIPPIDAVIGPETSDFFPSVVPGAPEDPLVPLLVAGPMLVLDMQLQMKPDLLGIPGDADLDGDVDLDDFRTLKMHFGLQSGATWGMGDFNDSGSITLEDFVILKNHFGQTSTP